MEKRRWYSVAETAEISGISASKLWSLKGDGLLVVGKHWVYLSGKKNSPVGWSVDAIHAWQIEQSIKVVEAPIKAAEEIEDYAAMAV
jgi:hypothetical protein